MSDSLKKSFKDQEDRKREIMRLALLDEFNKGMKEGLSQNKIDSNLSSLKRILEKQYGIPFSMAYGGAVDSMQPSDLHRQIQQADRLMRADGKTTKEIDIFKQQKRREIFEGPTNNRVTEGVGSLNQTARDMFRGPRGIGAYQQFAEGGAASARDKVEIESLRNAVMMTESGSKRG